MFFYVTREAAAWPAIMLKHIEDNAPHGAANLFTVWHRVSTDGWTSNAFAEALEQLITLDYVEIVGDRVALKPSPVAVALEPQL